MMNNKYITLMAIMAALFTSEVYAGEAVYNQPVKVYNNSSSSIIVNPGYLGNDIINPNHKFDCSGDPNSGAKYSCVAISPAATSIPSKQGQTFTISSSVRSLPPGPAFLYGGVFFQIDPVNTFEGNIVTIPISANPVVAYASPVVTAEGQPIQIGAAYNTTEQLMSPITSSVGIYGTGGVPTLYIVVDDNPLYRMKNHSPTQAGPF
jgi:hypothetical protein